MTLKQIRVMHNLTQKELAEILDVSQTAISNWESGVAWPRRKVMKQLADIYSLTVPEIADVLNNSQKGEMINHEADK